MHLESPMWDFGRLLITCQAKHGLSMINPTTPRPSVTESCMSFAELCFMAPSLFQRFSSKQVQRACTLNQRFYIYMVTLRPTACGICIWFPSYGAIAFISITQSLVYGYCTSKDWMSSVFQLDPSQSQPFHAELLYSCNVEGFPFFFWSIRGTTCVLSVHQNGNQKYTMDLFSSTYSPTNSCES